MSSICLSKFNRMHVWTIRTDRIFSRVKVRSSVGHVRRICSGGRTFSSDPSHQFHKNDSSTQYKSDSFARHRTLISVSGWIRAILTEYFLFCLGHGFSGTKGMNDESVSGTSKQYGLGKFATSSSFTKLQSRGCWNIQFIHLNWIWWMIKNQHVISFRLNMLFFVIFSIQFGYDRAIDSIAFSSDSFQNCTLFVSVNKYICCECFLLWWPSK